MVHISIEDLAKRIRTDTNIIERYERMEEALETTRNMLSYYTFNNISEHKAPYDVVQHLNRAKEHLDKALANFKKEGE